jgi:hypothetical protein
MPAFRPEQARVDAAARHSLLVPSEHAVSGEARYRSRNEKRASRPAFGDEQVPCDARV